METFCQSRTERKRNMFYGVETKQKESCQRTTSETPNRIESLQRRQTKK